MRLVDYLDTGADLGPDRPCLTTDGRSRSYAAVQELSSRVAAALVARGVRPGDRVAILSANDPTSFTCVFGISRAGAVWCPVNPRNEAAENRRAPRPVRLHRAALPAGVRTARRRDPRRPARADDARVPGRRRPGGRPDAPPPDAPPPDALSWNDFLAARGRRRTGRRTGPRRPRDDRRHGRDDGPPEGRRAHRPEHRDDDGAHAHELPVRRLRRCTWRWHRSRTRRGCCASR